MTIKLCDSFYRFLFFKLCDSLVSIPTGFFVSVCRFGVPLRMRTRPKIGGKNTWEIPPFSKYVQTWLTHRIRTRRSNMDYSWSLLRFLKVILIVTSVYWCILLSILVFLLLGQCSTGDFDHSAGVQAGLVMIVFIIVLSVGGGALVILLVAFHVLSQQYFKGIDINFYLVQSLYY